MKRKRLTMVFGFTFKILAARLCETPEFKRSFRGWVILLFFWCRAAVFVEFEKCLPQALQKNLRIRLASELR